MSEEKKTNKEIYICEECGEIIPEKDVWCEEGTTEYIHVTKENSKYCGPVKKYVHKEIKYASEEKDMVERVVYVPVYVQYPYWYPYDQYPNITYEGGNTGTKFEVKTTLLHSTTVPVHTVFV